MDSDKVKALLAFPEHREFRVKLVSDPTIGFSGGEATGSLVVVLPRGCLFAPDVPTDGNQARWLPFLMADPVMHQDSDSADIVMDYPILPQELDMQPPKAITFHVQRKDMEGLYFTLMYHTMAVHKMFTLPQTPSEQALETYLKMDEERCRQLLEGMNAIACNVLAYLQNSGVVSGGTPPAPPPDSSGSGSGVSGGQEDSEEVIVQPFPKPSSRFGFGSLKFWARKPQLSGSDVDGGGGGSDPQSTAESSSAPKDSTPTPATRCFGYGTGAQKRKSEAPTNNSNAKKQDRRYNPL